MRKVLSAICLISLAAMSTLMAAPAKLIPPAYLTNPARLGAAELQAETCFQIIDWNGDGHRDILQRSRGGDRGWLFINKGTDKEPWFEFVERLPCNFSELEKRHIGVMSDYWACDFDGDGDLDIVFTIADTGPGGLMVAVNLGEKTFTWLQDGIYLPNTKGRGTLCAVDMDGDGRPDIYQQPDKGGLILHRNLTENGVINTGPAEAVVDINGQPVSAPNPYPVDFNGDGTLDLVSVTTSNVLFFAGVPGKNGLVFQPPVIARNGSGQPIVGGQDVNVLDWDLDGTLDLLVLDVNCVIRCHNGTKKGSPVFAEDAKLITGSAFARADVRPVPSLFDWDKDGRYDLVLGAAHDEYCSGSRPWARSYRNILGSGRCPLGEGSFVRDTTDRNLTIVNPCVCDFDGDGNADIVYGMRINGKIVEVFLLRGSAQAPYIFNSKPEKLLEVETSDTTESSARVCVTDWNGDGQPDLVFNHWAYNATGYVLALNKGTAKEPSFPEQQTLMIGDKPLKAHRAAICTADWDGDGKPDLLISFKDKLSWLRNADGTAQLALPSGTPLPPERDSTTTGVEIKIGDGENARSLPLSGPLTAGDFDGDGVIDIVMGQNYSYGFYCLADSRCWLFRGIAANQPPAVGAISVTKTTDKSVTLTFAGLTEKNNAEVRYATQPIDEVTWFRATPVKQAIKKGELTVTGLERGKTYYFAACNIGGGGQRSRLSDCLLVPTLPLKRAVIAQGVSAPELGADKYNGCTDLFIRGGQPPAKPEDGKGLRNQWVPPQHGQRDTVESYIKFDLAPLKGKKVHRAIFSLTSQGGQLRGDKRIRCREVLAPWEPQTITFETRDGTNKWEEKDWGAVLIDIDSEPISGCKRWDATEAINRALKNEVPLLSLHMSLGPYGSSNHYFDSETANPENRPNLLVLFE